MTPHEIEAMTPHQLALELEWVPGNQLPANMAVALFACRDMAVKAMREAPQDVLEVPERIAAEIASTLWFREAYTLALILLRAYTPEEP